MRKTSTAAKSQDDFSNLNGSKLTNGYGIMAGDTQLSARSVLSIDRPTITHLLFTLNSLLGFATGRKVLNDSLIMNGVKTIRMPRESQGETNQQLHFS